MKLQKCAVLKARAIFRVNLKKYADAALLNTVK